ncbi:dicarboxylate/amino acid:cation symporter [Anaerococcus sp. WCA-380-WT-2B]|uniref:Dicarboxylate/amino acid:cation symporter n=1 Tax=Anaerococcus porci TaxID=2652269 RepID=A0A6N7VUB2_9FIRM|nr:dicarboxylate/amino acid:cation symporter [Anaerococcus porci]MSS78446.1 dicarboxylate/amino acid:cation symporter [Anaerococcus porci]
MTKGKGILDNLLVKLIIAIAIGVLIGNFVNEPIMEVISTIKYVLSNLINYIVPLIILGFITPAIVSLNENAGKVLSITLIICYISSIGASFFSYIAGTLIIPHLNIVNDAANAKKLPELLFQVDIPPLMAVMTALVTSILIGLAVIWTKSGRWEELLKEFNNMILALVNKVVIKILPVYIATTFAELSYEGVIVSQFPVFLKVILIVMLGHYIWLLLLYLIGGAISKTNPMEVIKHYPPAYLTAIGTMSSAATLSVSLKCSAKSKTLDPKIRDFVVSLCSNTHLCGSVLTETFFVMVVSQILYGKLPDVGSMILFILLLGIFAIGAPGVPGGTVMASLGLITSVLGFDATGTALMLSIFALQDSFGTACNVTGDGAIALMVTGIFKKVPGRDGNPPYKGDLS